MSRTVDVVTDIRARIGKASGVFQRLNNVWRVEMQQHWHEHQVTSLYLSCHTYCHMPERPGQLWPRLYKAHAGCVQQAMSA